MDSRKIILPISLAPVRREKANLALNKQEKKKKKMVHVCVHRIGELEIMDPEEN